MGRKKIKIQPIKEDRNRSVTYLKRKAGLFKKAHELAVLTDSQVAVIVFGHNGKLAEFCSTDIDLLLLRYTEYDGIAERKGPHNYLHLDKDSDDNDDDDNDDDDNDNDENDNDSADGPNEHFADPNRANGRETAGGSGRNAKGLSGTKRKSEHRSPSGRSNGFNPSSVAAAAASSSLGAGFDIATGPSAKQTLNAAIRQKSQNHSSTHSTSVAADFVPTQGVYHSVPFGHATMPDPGMQHEHSVMGASMTSMAPKMSSPAMPEANNRVTGQATSSSSASANPTRAQAIANMSICMPTDDRIPSFTSPTIPGFGLTPGGTVVTPGGRRFSFSDVLSRSCTNMTVQRPVTASSSLVPHLFHTDTLSLTATPPQDASLSAVLRSSSPLIARPATTAFHRSMTPTYSQATYAPTSEASLVHNNASSFGADIIRPFTAAANLELASSSNHLALPVADFAQSAHASSASPVAHSSSVGVSTTGGSTSALIASPFVGSSLKASATPELVSHSTHPLARDSLAASVSRSSMSTDKETPPTHGDSAGANDARLDSSAIWFNLGQSTDAKSDKTMPEQGSLVQPAPINASQTLASIPFDLKFPAQPMQ